MDSALPDRAAIQCELAAEVVREYGSLRFRAHGASMLPTIWPGDVLSVRAVALATIRPGDIVLVARASGWCAHRVLSRSGTTLITRGDALAAVDPPVTEADLLGRITAVEHAGCERELGPRTIANRVVASLLRRFDPLTNILLHWQSLRRRIARRRSSGKFAFR